MNLALVISNVFSGSIELAILFILFAIFFIYGFYKGKDKMVSVLVSYYLASFIYIQFPYLNKFIIFQETNLQIFINKLIVFMIFFLPIHLLLNRLIVVDFSFGFLRKTIESSLLSIIMTGLSFVFLINIVPIHKIHKFSETAISLFGTPNALLFWLIVPIVALFFLVRR